MPAGLGHRWKSGGGADPFTGPSASHCGAAACTRHRQPAQKVASGTGTHLRSSMTISLELAGGGGGGGGGRLDVAWAAAAAV